MSRTSLAQSPSPDFPRLVRRWLLAAGCVLLAGLVAVGCGGDDEGGSQGGATPDAIAGDALSWLPTDTWVVATLDVDPKSIDVALETLGRLPIWALAEGQLPAGDGAGLRKELLAQAAKQTKGTTAKQLEAAFGTQLGFALFGSSDVTTLTDGDAPYLAWIAVDDEDAALKAARDMYAGSEESKEHAGTTYYTSKDDDAAFAVEGGLLLLTTTGARMEQLIDVHEDGDSLADDETAAAVMQAGIGDGVAGFAIGTDALAAALPQMLRAQAAKLDDDGAQARAEESADTVERIIEAGAFDPLVPDWVASSITIDATGVRGRSSWSNPRPIADADPSSRELVERMPADAPIVSGAVSDGSSLRRVQDAWATVADEADVDLRELAACNDAGQLAWLCTLGVETALTLLEDGDLAEAVDDQPDSATVLVQDLAPLLQATASAAAAASPPNAPGARPKAAAPKLEARLFEVASTMTGVLDWKPDAQLQEAMDAAGLQVTAAKDGGVTVRVVPTSPMGRALRTQLDAEARIALRGAGIDVGVLTSPAGLSISPEQVDDIAVAGFPSSAPSKVAPALSGDVDTLGDSVDYRDAVDAVQPPENVGSYSWLHLSGYVMGTLESLAATEPDVGRFLPTVRNNLSDIPGVLAWSTREEVDGIEVGVSETVIPILD
jgi:hypothetical protein